MISAPVNEIRGPTEADIDPLQDGSQMELAVNTERDAWFGNKKKWQDLLQYLI